MYWNLLCQKNNLQLQLSDFEDEKSIKSFQAIIGSLKSKNKPSRIGFCKCCGSYNLIGWGGYERYCESVGHSPCFSSPIFTRY